jgi:UDP-N-acetylmuramyl pentapeptide phosphotransferase/UDP-N-acetylglucosamine-1-phosphate transferase
MNSGMPVEFLILWAAAAALAAGVLTWTAIGYAHRVGLLDHEGKRRSHSGSVPRGGGAAIVVVAALAALFVTHGHDDVAVTTWYAFVAGLAAVALVGWIDDHRPLPALSRLLVHLVAALVFVAAMAGPVGGAEISRLLPALLAVSAIAVAINFWNFMDGINGIAALQAVFVCALLAHAFAAAEMSGAMLVTLALAAACIGFVPFNLPRARIFLGDVGSGGIGFAVGALLLLAVARGALDTWTALLLTSAFWLDAGLTLASRMLRGRRWYTAHREHLYQWLVRRGRSHAQVDLVFAAWNLLIVTPLYVLVVSETLPSPVALAVVVALGAAAWWGVRRMLLRSARFYGFR